MGLERPEVNLHRFLVENGIKHDGILLNCDGEASAPCMRCDPVRFDTWCYEAARKSVFGLMLYQARKNIPAIYEKNLQMMSLISGNQWSDAR